MAREGNVLPSDPNYLNIERLWNDIERVEVGVGGQKKALAVAILDSNGNVVTTPVAGDHKRVTVTTAGTPHNLSSGTTVQGSSVPCKKVYLTALPTQGQYMAIGFDNSVRATSGNENGIMLVGGNSPLVLDVDDLADVWVDASADGGVLCIGWVT